MTSPTQSPPRTSPHPQGRNFEEIWDRYGGGDIPATIAGLLAAIGTLIMLIGLIAAGAGNIALQVDNIDVDGNFVEFSLAGAVTFIIVLFVSFFVGGWVAARMARFDGPKNGVIVALWMLALIVIFGALGAWAGAEYNVFAQIDLPDWVSVWDNDWENGEALTGAAVAAGIGALVMFAGGYLGGQVGDAYNTRVNAAIANTTPEPIVNR